MKSQRPHINELLQSGCILSSGSNEYWLGWGRSVKRSNPALSSALDPALDLALGPDLGKISLYTPDFFLKDPTPWQVFPHSCKLSHAELNALLLTHESFSSPLSGESGRGAEVAILWKAAELQEFRLAFQDLQQQFERGTLRKAVPIVLEEGEFRDTSDSVLKYRATLLFQLLRSTQGFPLYLYGVWDSEEGILGATPEILFEQTEPGYLNTVAIAGTRSRAQLVASRSPGLFPSLSPDLLPDLSQDLLPSLSPSLLDDPKELEEHRIVIEGIRNSLAEFGEVKVGTTRELELPSLVHLMTPVTLIQAQRDTGFSFETAVRMLHPTPALGAFPKAAGHLWLENYPLNRKRKKFGAPFGATWASGISLCVVAIRNIQWQGFNYVIGAGCGVVPASQLDRECDELRAKIRSVKKSFDIL